VPSEKEAAKINEKASRWNVAIRKYFVLNCPIVASDIFGGQDMNRANEVLSVRSSAQPSDDASVFVIDADRSVRESLESLIAGAGWQPRSFNSAEAFLAYPRLMTRSCLVSDMALPDLDGLQLQGLLVARRELPIIFVSSRVDIPRTVQAMKAGAVEFLAKPVDEEVLLQAVRQALERSSEALHREAKMRQLRQGYASLSCREREVMALITQGMLNKCVGAELGISEITVKAHRGKVMRKMAARSLAELVIMGASLGLPPVVTKPRRFAGVRREYQLPQAMTGFVRAT
jgi:FixJ family two-component response regulator